MHKRRLVILAVLLAALVASVAAETPVTLNPAEQRNAAVSGNVVVWQDYRNGNWDIYMKNLVTNVETRVSSSVADEMYPDIDGTRIVYQFGVGDILLYDIAAGTTSTVVAVPGEQSHPRISGDWVVYQDHRGSTWDVYFYNLATHVDSLMTDIGDQHAPSVEGTQMVWISDTDGGFASVIAYDTTTSVRTLITSLSHPSVPDVAAGMVTYVDWDVLNTGDQKVFYRPITSGTPHYVPGIGGDHDGGQRVDGTRVALSADGIGMDIWVYDLFSGTATQITSNGVDAADSNPAIDGTRVVWETNRNGNWDIYTEEIGGGSVMVPGGAGKPTDVDGDSLYEDVNGNDRKDFADVVLYFNQMAWVAANEPMAGFDYNGNGRIDFADVVWLFANL